MIREPKNDDCLRRGSANWVYKGYAVIQSHLEISSHSAVYTHLLDLAEDGMVRL